MIKRRILFVDDESMILDGLRRMLHPMRCEWNISFAQSGHEALDILAGESFDVIITDVRMPGIDGSQLLREVTERHPQMVRIVLSGQAEDETVLQSVRHVHQYLSKPCDTEMLRSTIVRACALSDLLEDETLKRLISQMETLPSLPSLCRTIEQELRSPEASTRKIAEIISQDIGMSAKVLQLVNSAFFGIRQPVATPGQAAVLLGLETIRNLVLSVHLFAQFGQADLGGLSLEVLWNHSMNAGMYARQLAMSENMDSETVDHAFTGGLLHDAGKLVLAANLAEEYASVLTRASRTGIALYEAEREVFGSTHAEVGCYLMGLWGLPDPIVEALAFHHCPSRHGEEGFTPVTAVHVADILEHEMYSAESIQASREVDDAYLTHLGLSERQTEWRARCREIAEGEDDR